MTLVLRRCWFVLVLIASIVPAAPAAAAPRCLGRNVTIAGTPGDDVLRGTRGPDVIDAGDGHDVVRGRGGADVVCGGSGDDSIRGGRGSDRIAGQKGIDTVRGNRGHDVIQMGCSECFDLDESEPQYAFGGRGNDRMLGGREQDVMHGGPGRDHLRGWGSEQAGSFGLPDELFGDKGDDVLIARDETGGYGAGTFLGGGPGNDELRSYDPTARLQGNEGDDVLAGPPGSRTTADFSTSATAVTVDLAEGLATGEGLDTLENVTVVEGSRHSDVLSGTEGDDALVGRAGDDAIDGRGGDDTLLGDFLDGLGDDTLTGGDGSDSVSYMYAPGPVHVDLAAGVATGEGEDALDDVERVTGSRFADVLLGDDEANALFGFGTPGGEGRERIDGRGGDDEIRVDSAAPGDVDGGRGNDLITGWLGDDVLRGGSGNDTIRGEGGNDDLDGGEGVDVLDGGTGSDTCRNGEQLQSCETDR